LPQSASAERRYCHLRRRLRRLRASGSRPLP
jgi:hypothetical protein